MIGRERPTSKPRHCERSAAIQGDGLLRLDCFGLRPRNDDGSRDVASGPPSLRAKRGNPADGLSPGLLHPSGSQ
ncbi:MAG: hypothetical protein LBT00_13520 [Spirochaetaceae bacterium]|nr:hypothetical protein [Spirochaetaceae bacterium]